MEGLGHERHVVHGRDGLALADRQRLVVVGEPPRLGRDESMAGDGAEGVEDALILDPALDEVALDHPLSSGGLGVVRLGVVADQEGRGDHQGVRAEVAHGVASVEIRQLAPGDSSSCSTCTASPAANRSRASREARRTWL